MALVSCRAKIEENAKKDIGVVSKEEDSSRNTVPINDIINGVILV